MRRFCKGTGGLSEYAFGRHLMVSQSLKVLYCLTPKCASRQLRKLLFSNQPKKRLKSYSKQDQSMILKTYFKFTFVREPFERLLSAYKDKFVYSRKMDRYLLKRHGREILKNFRPNASQRAYEELNDITFHEFVEYLVKEGSDRTTRVMDFHWDNYVNICEMCSIDYDFIGHYETMEQDITDFLAAARLPSQDARIFEAYKHTSPKTSSELLKYYSQIPLEWINSLGRIYNTSFEMFGYSFPGPLKSLYGNNTVT